MICPHCRANLLRKERTGGRCSKCRRDFAFDPKTNRFGLHDVKLHTLATKLSDNGRLRYTGTQLWYAAARKTIREDAGKTPGLGSGIVVAFGVAGLGCGVFMTDVRFVIGGAAVLGLALLVLVLRLRGVFKTRVRPRIGAPEFVRDLTGRWARVYRTLPAGMVAGTKPVQPPPRPVAAILCFDRAVIECLTANQVQHTFQVLVTDAPAQVPPGVPIGIMRDASVRGQDLVRYARTTFPGRSVVDLGLRPASVLAAKNPVKLREDKPSAESLAALRADGTLSDKELNWLADGWWSPLAALPPLALVTRVEAFVHRQGERRDPDQRAAASVGFLTWPAA